MKMVKISWSTLSEQPISEEAIRALHQPQKRYKFYVNKIEPGKSLPTKAGHDFVLYVLTGSCKISVDGIEMILSSSESISLEKGAYLFEALGDEQLKIMKVFSLSSQA
jgi:hypothetical protein